MVERKPLFQEKQKEVYSEYQNEKVNLQKGFEDSKKKYEEKIQELKKIQQSILNIQYVSLKDSQEAIARLISLIEEKDYVVKEFTTKLYYPKYYMKNLISKHHGEDYYIHYAVDKDKEHEAERDLRERFEPMAWELNDRYLSIPSDNYIQLAYYKDTDVKKIYYTNRNVFDVNTYPNFGLESKICDERYHYILDYMDSVVKYKLDQKDFNISLDEMKILAYSFAQDYKQNKIKVKK